MSAVAKFAPEIVWFASDPNHTTSTDINEALKQDNRVLKCVFFNHNALVSFAESVFA